MLNNWAPWGKEIWKEIFPCCTGRNCRCFCGFTGFRHLHGWNAQQKGPLSLIPTVLLGNIVWHPTHSVFYLCCYSLFTTLCYWSALSIAYLLPDSQSYAVVTFRFWTSRQRAHQRRKAPSPSPAANIIIDLRVWEKGRYRRQHKWISLRQVFSLLFWCLRS